MFRTMLEHGLRPSRVIYGTFLQELNGISSVHSNIKDEDTSHLKIKDKSLFNVLYYGPTALAPILNVSTFHIYLFALNNAFREVHNPNFFQRLSFGVNFFERDSNYRMSYEFLHDLKEIYYLCKQRNIPFAFFNTPIRSHITSLADLPYKHREEAYVAIESFAIQNNIPIWNFDKPDIFEDKDFLDTYHLTPEGARRMTALLADKITLWNKGIIEQDIVSTSTDTIGPEIKDSLVRTVFHF